MILTNGFDPDPRVYKEALSLVKLGHSVTILCWDRESKYRDKPIEIIDGIKIVRFFATSKYGSGYKQALKFWSFRNEVLNYVRNNTFDALHCHDFDGFFIGYTISKKVRVKLVYDEHDLFYMYFANRKGIINKFICNIIKYSEKIMLKRVDNHIVVTPEMAKLYINLSNKLTIINNAPLSTIFNDIHKTPSNKLRIGYIGSVRYLEELKVLIDVSQKFKDKVDIIISGRGIVLDELRSYSSSFENVIITGAFSMDQLEDLYKNIDITYAFYPSDVSTISMPNKFYESIITETPIIANKETEFGKEVMKNNIGYSITENSLREELENVISELIENNTIRECIVENMRRIKGDYVWEANDKKLEAIYAS